MAQFKFESHETVLHTVITPVTVEADNYDEAVAKLKECMDNRCVPGHKVAGVKFGESRLADNYDYLPMDYSHQLDDDVETIYNEDDERVWGDRWEGDNEDED